VRRPQTEISTEDGQMDLIEVPSIRQYAPCIGAIGKASIGSTRFR
jgi:hypothetical protein